jgi:hypothetical protein
MPCGECVRAIWYLQVYGDEPRVSSILFTAKRARRNQGLEELGNVVTRAAMLEVFEAYRLVSSLSIQHEV